MLRLHIFETVERGADGQPVVVCWYRDTHDQQAILRFPLSLIEEMRQHAYNALGEAPGGTYPSPVRTPRPAASRGPSTSVEAKVRRVYQPGMSVSQLERAAGVSRSAASKYWRLLQAAVDL